MLETATETAKSQIEDAQQWLTRLPDNVSRAFNEGLDATRRGLKRSLETAEELSDEVRYQVKRHPFKVAAISLGVGLGTGLLVGWAIASKRRSWKFW